MGDNYVTLLDGGFSSQISRHVNFDAEYANHPLWCARFLITDPDSVVKTHRDYIQAGADIITTNTYQASIEGFQKYFKLSFHESYRTIKNAVQLARDAISLENETRISKKQVLIAGSVGSYGACLHDGSEYNGDYMKSVDKNFLKDWHRPRMTALIESGVDFLAIETIPALKEAEIIMELLQEFPNQKAWISFTCKDDEHTAAHDQITYAARKLWSVNENQLIAIGVNCLHPSLVSRLISCINEDKSKDLFIPTIAYPNSGEIFDMTKKKWIKFQENPPVHSYMSNWLKKGVRFIGGCCRTTAEDIKLFRRQIDLFNETHSNDR